jgi:hypothetical protein
MWSARAALTALSCIAGLLAALPVAADPGVADILRIRQPSAGALAFFGDCSNVKDPPIGTVCHETFVILYRENPVEGGGSIAPSTAPWALYVVSYTLTFGAPLGSDPIQSDFVDGFLLAPPVAVSDDQHLSSAAVAAQVPLSNGSTFDFHANWAATSGRFVYGNNGPDNDGLPRHYSDRCSTVNNNVHEKLRYATMTGTVNGFPVQSYAQFDDAAEVFINHFVYIDVSHDACPR